MVDFGMTPTVVRSSSSLTEVPARSSSVFPSASLAAANGKEDGDSEVEIDATAGPGRADMFRYSLKLKGISSIYTTTLGFLHG